MSECPNERFEVTSPSRTVGRHTHGQCWRRWFHRRHERTGPPGSITCGSCVLLLVSICRHGVMLPQHRCLHDGDSERGEQFQLRPCSCSRLLQSGLDLRQEQHSHILHLGQRHYRGPNHERDTIRSQRGRNMHGSYDPTHFGTQRLDGDRLLYHETRQQPRFYSCRQNSRGSFRRHVDCFICDVYQHNDLDCDHNYS